MSSTRVVCHCVRRRTGIVDLHAVRGWPSIVQYPGITWIRFWPIVIGELGVCGHDMEKRAENPDAHEAVAMVKFRKAQRAVADDPSLGNVTFVPTADFWDTRLQELRIMADKYWSVKQQMKIKDTDDNVLPTKELICTTSGRRTTRRSTTPRSAASRSQSAARPSKRDSVAREDPPSCSRLTVAPIVLGRLWQWTNPQRRTPKDDSGCTMKTSSPTRFCGTAAR